MVLGLIADEPRHGYDIIKHLKERFQGSYSPSPGSIYPLLKSLAGVGFVTVTTDGKKRRFTITDAGRDWLATQADELKAINLQLAQAATSIGTHKIGDAISALRATLFATMRVGSVDEEKAARMADVLNKARESIEQISAEDAAA